MIAWLVSQTGHVATVALEDRRTVTDDWYTTICLPDVIDELRKSNNNLRITLHYHNASSPHSTYKNCIFERAERRIIGPSTYSPDLSPNEFFTFQKIKDQMRGQRFS